MTSFILIAILITIVAITFLVWPLVKPQVSTSYERQAQNIHFARERLRELEQQFANGGISATDHAALKLEIETTLAEDIDLNQSAEDPGTPDTKSSNGILIALLCSLIPFAALVLYQITGTPAALQAPSAVASAGAAITPSQQDIDSMVSSLEQRLQTTPDDLDGWTMLARTYLVLERYAEAIQANKRVLELGGENPDVYAALADASALQAGGDLSGQPGEYVRQALRLDPQHPQALWLAGLSAAQQGNNSSARGYWDKLLPLLADVPAQQDELRRIIAQTFAEEAVPQAVPAASETTPGQTGDGAVALHVRIELDAAVAGLSSPEDLVFVFAKAKNGPPAPLAVKRLRVADLPAEVSLSDADGMVAQFKLSLFENVVVSARVAKSGNPVAQPGDLQSPSIASSNKNTALIELKISEIVK